MTEAERTFRVTNAAYIERLHDKADGYVKHIKALEADNAALRQHIEDRRLNNEANSRRVQEYNEISTKLLKVIEKKDARNAALRKRVEAVVSQLRANQLQHKTLAEGNPRRTTHLAFTAAFGEAATLLEKALTTDDAAEGEGTA
jgi:flagellar biosynthesis chaperone FliJ